MIRKIHLAKCLNTNNWEAVRKDINLRLKADSLGIPVEDFERQRVNFDELFSGESEMNVPAQAIEDFYKNGFLEIENTLLANEFVVLKDESNPKRSALGWKRGERIEAIPHEFSDKVWNVSPRSKEQRMALTILMDPSIQIVTLVGQAGSGKTLLALAAALETTIQQNLYDRILVSRPIIPMGNDLGYLPGGDKTITTLHQTSLQAMTAGIELLAPDGAILCAVYPGHVEGTVEGNLIEDFLSTLDRRLFCATKFKIVNSPTSPFFFLIEKK